MSWRWGELNGKFEGVGEGLHMHRNTLDEGRRRGTDVSGFPALGDRAGLQPGPHHTEKEKPEHDWC